MEKLESCRKCPRWKATLIPHEIRQGAKLAIIGEAPGKEEYETGRPFVGRAGKTLDILLGKSGSNRQLVSVLNTVACYVEGNPAPTIEEICCCAPVLESALAEANPRVVLTMGTIASKRMAGHRALTVWRGSIIEADGKITLGKTTILDESDPIKSGPNKGKPRRKKKDLGIEQQAGRTIVITNHPAELLYGNFSRWPLVQADVQRAVRLANGKPLIQVGSSIETRLRDTERLENLLGDHDELTMDLEASRETGRITMIGIAPDKDHAFVFYPTANVFDLLGRWLEDDRNTLIGHNIVGYDIRKFREKGIATQCNVWDTYVAAHYERPDILRSEKKKQNDSDNGSETVGKSLSLDMVCSRMSRLHYYNWKEAFRSGADLDEWTYCGLDCCHEAYLKEELERRLKATDQLDRFNKVLMPLSRIVADMEDIGLRVDESARQRLLKGATRLSDRLNQEWTKETLGVDPASTPELRGYFYDTLQLKPVMDPETERPTLDREALDELAVSYPSCKPLRILRDLRHVEKMLSTYLQREVDGLGHAHFTTRLAGTISGRFAGDGQQIPRASSDGSCHQGVDGCCCGKIRSIYTHDSDDECLVVADYSQIEDRIIAHLAGEQWLVEAFDDPAFDHYSVVAEELSNLLNKSIDRRVAKKLTLATNYLMSIRRLAKELSCKESEAREFFHALKRLKPRIHEYRMKLVERATKQMWIANPFGRRLHFSGIPEASKVVAFLPQSSAFDVIADAMLRTAEAGLKIRLQIHDELLVSGSRSDVKKLAEAMQLPHAALGGWYCPVEVGCGRNWLEAKASAKRFSRS